MKISIDNSPSINSRKGIILAGGSGTRLYPLTLSISKQLLPIYDKPMIYYPLATLMLAKIKDILIISTPHDIEDYKNLLGDGGDFGINLSYKIQKNPEGLAQAFIIAEDFINESKSALILGDNIFYGNDLGKTLINAQNKQKGASIFTYHVSDPHRYGVVEYDKNNKVLSIEEKPKNPKSKYAVTGLYFYDEDVVEYAKKLKPSLRGELEITDLNNIYIEKNLLDVNFLNRGYAWLDTGTFDSLQEAGLFISTIEKRQGLKIACLEEIAYNNGWLSRSDILKASSKLNNDYGKYLEKLLI
jgi:glucose-1-phosphate thymidylyltransferase